MLPTEELLRFIRRYSECFPDEFLPTTDSIEMLRVIATYSIESKYNLLYVFGDGTVLMHWCLANKDAPREFNMRAFFEVLRFLKRKKMVASFEVLNDEYVGAIERSNMRISEHGMR